MYVFSPRFANTSPLKNLLAVIVLPSHLSIENSIGLTLTGFFSFLFKEKMIPTAETASSKTEQIIAEILNIDKTTINLDSHFIVDLGGGSLEYLCFILKLKEEFLIDVADDIELYTPRQVCDYISSKN